MKGQCANVEKDQRIDHQEPVASRRDPVVHRGEGDYHATPLSDEHQEQRNKDGENRDKESGDEKLEQFWLPFVFVQVSLLYYNFRDM